MNRWLLIHPAVSTFCQPDQLPAQISISVEGGGRRTIHFGQTVYSLSEQIADATARVRRCRRLALLWSILSIAFSFCVLCAAFASAEPHSQRGFTGIPSRRFVLPVATWTLVGWPLGLGAAAVLVMWLAWTPAVLPGVPPLEVGFSKPYLPARVCWHSATVPERANPVVSLPLIWEAAELHISAGWNEDADIYLPVAALLVPLARIGLSPLAVRMNRHR